MSVAPSDAPSSVFVPDPCPMKKIPENVLQEEDYSEAVSAIIERDFFPDLPHLRVKREMLLALAAGEEETARDLRWKLANMTRPTPLSELAGTPRATPRPTPGDSTPAQADAAASTPAPTPPPTEGTAPAGLLQGADGANQARLSAWERDDDAESMVTRTVDGLHLTRLKLADGKEVNVDLSAVRLDDFQRVFTSEDNASFEAIIARDKEKRRNLQFWIEGPEKEHNTLHKAQCKALENGELEGGVIMYTPTQGRHPVSFFSVGHPQPDTEKPLVEFKNTRFTSKQQVELDCMLAAGMVSRKARLEGEKLENAFEEAAKQGKFDLPSITGPAPRALGGRLQTPLLGGSGVEHKGFPLVKTPTLLPGVNGLSPLMTYGVVASTPKLLEDETRGPNFHIVDQSPRELAAERLQRGATQRQRESKQLTKAERLRALGITPTTPNRSTPSGSLRQTPCSVTSKVTPLSPIGQLLHRAQKMAQKGGQLRIASGRSSRPSSSEALPRKRARAERDWAPAASKLPASITDDLL